ncbi:hypothetical protein Taro_042368, partial [Colocasia esculenta]|nr:hypothetical protein [Colocasia esculenta]
YEAERGLGKKAPVGAISTSSGALASLHKQELDGKLAAVKILSWRQYRVPLTMVGGNPLAAKFFSKLNM